MGTKEKGLKIALAVSTALCIGLLIGVIVLAVRLADDDNDAITEPTGPTTTGLTEPTEHTGPTTTGLTEPTTTTTTIDVCKTPECLIEAARILNSIDTTVNPCEDFFKFSCGNWQIKNPIPATAGSHGSFNILRDELSANIRGILESDLSEYPDIVRKSQTFYETCLKMAENTDPHADFETVVEDLIVDSSNSIENLGQTLGKIRRAIGISPLVSLSVSLDEKNTTNNVIYIDTLEFGLARAYLVNQNETNTNRVAYRKLMETIFPIVYPDLTGVDYDALVKLEADLARVTLSPEDRRDKELIYNNVTLDELKALTSSDPIFNWDMYLEEIFSEVLPGHDFNENKIIVRDTAYLTSMVDILKAVPDILVNFLRWRLLSSQGTHVSQTLRDHFFQYSKETTQVTTPTPRWQVCSDLTNAYFGMAISNPYIVKHFPNDKIEKMNTMVRLITEAFGDILQDLDWLDDITRELAKDKADSMDPKMAYPEWILNATELEAFYTGLDLTQADFHFQNKLDASYFGNKRSLSDITKQKDPSSWRTDPTVVNAFYSSIYNSISFPAGILQIPFFGMPLEAMNYGGIGAVIGHEITHGFDDRGRQSDKDGNLHEWWSPEIIAAYQEKAQCFINQYASYVDPQVGIPLNGNNTLGENIADNGGLRESFLAYQKWVVTNGEEPRLPGLEQYTPEQLFYMAFGQIWCVSWKDAALVNQILTGVHSPGHFRVKGTLDNSHEFAATWNCPAPPENSCRIW